MLVAASVVLCVKTVLKINFRFGVFNATFQFSADI